MLELLYADSHFFPYPTAIPAKISECSPWSRSVNLGLVVYRERTEQAY